MQVLEVVIADWVLLVVVLEVVGFFPRGQNSNPSYDSSQEKLDQKHTRFDLKQTQLGTNFSVFCLTLAPMVLNV